MEICASLNHRKKTKADGSPLIPRKHTDGCHWQLPVVIGK